MKRFLAFFLAIQIIILILSGCSIPFFGNSAENQTDKAGSLDMIELDDGTTAYGNETLHDSGAADATHTDDGSAAGSAYTDDGSGDDMPSGAGNKSATAGAVNRDDEVGHINPAGGVTDPYVPASSSEYDEGLSGYDRNAGIGGNASNGGVSNGYASNSSASSGWPNSTGPYGTGVLSAEKTPAGSHSEPRRPVTVYYQDDDGCIVPMTRWIQPQLGIARAAVSLAVDSPVTREETAYYGVYPIIPENTEILGIDIRNGTAVIDFSRSLLNYGTAYSERNIVAAIVYTLTEFETIDKVKILINGYVPGLLKYGTDLSEAIGREDLMINANLSSLPAGMKKLDVYCLKRANAGFTYPVPVSLAVGSEEMDPLPESLVKQLLSAEPAGGIYSEMPDGAFLRDSYVRDNVLILDFSEEFLNYESVLNEEAILKQLAYTIRQCKGINKINILVEGRNVKLPGGTNISAGLAVPVTINDVMDRG